MGPGVGSFSFHEEEVHPRFASPFAARDRFPGQNDQQKDLAAHCVPLYGTLGQNGYGERKRSVGRWMPSFLHMCHKSRNGVSPKSDAKARCGWPSLADSGKTIHDPNPLSPGHFLLKAVSGSRWRVGGGRADLVAAWCRLAAGLVPVW